MTDYPVQNPVNDLVQNTVNKTKNAVEKAEKWKLPLKFKILFPIIQLLPVVFVLLAFRAYRVPEFRWYTFLLVILALVPTVAVYFFLMTKSKNKKRRAVAIILCTVYVPISLILSFVAFPRSRTTNIEDYRLFDSGVSDSQVYELLPRYAVSNDAEYYYDYTVALGDVYYDICAQWSLTDNEFKKEVERIKERWQDAPIVKNGNYNCMVLYSSYPEGDVFSEVCGNVIIFAYDEATRCVRYIVSYGEFGESLQYYLQLDWQ